MSLGINLIFARNTHNRINTLNSTIKIDRDNFNAQHYISITDNGGINTNDINADKILIIPGIHHQINCINAFYALISKICSENDDGVIIFAHDDIPIVNKSIVEYNINYLLDNNLCFILRKPNIEDWGNNYYMMEVVYMRISLVKEKFKKYNNSFLKTLDEVPYDKNNWISAEVWLFNILNDLTPNYTFEFKNWYKLEDINNNLIDKMGFYHQNLGKREWEE
jgi:hypothetical protein